MQTIPIADLPSQILSITLGGQSCRLRIFQRGTSLFMDVYVNDAIIVLGSLCLNGVRVVRSAYLGFIGDLTFWDQQGVDDPLSPGLGTRFLLAYLEAT